MKLYQAIARTLAWDPPTEELQITRMERLSNLAKALPSGSGWDCGTRIDGDSTPDRPVLFGHFHHMDSNGSYRGWTDHAVIVTPSLAFGIEVKITGRDRNGIKDYLAELFHDALLEDVDEYTGKPEVYTEESRQ